MPMPINSSPSTKAPGRGPNKTRLKADEVRSIVPEYDKLGLSLREARFVAEYLTNGFNATNAYLNGVDPKSSRKNAGVQGHAYIQDQKVRGAVSRFMNQWLGERREKLETSIISVLWARAFYDPALFIQSDGTPTFTDWKQIPKAWRVCVDGIEKKYFGRDADQSAVTFKLANRDSALEKLARYVSLFAADQTDHNMTMTAETENRLKRIFAGIHPTQEGNAGGKGRKSGVSKAAVPSGFGEADE